MLQQLHKWVQTQITRRESGIHVMYIYICKDIGEYSYIYILRGAPNLRGVPSLRLRRNLKRCYDIGGLLKCGPSLDP